MTTSEQEAMASNEDTNTCDDPLDIGQVTDNPDIYESDHISYDSEQDEDEDEDMSNEAGQDHSEKDVEALYNNLSIYEFQLDKERFSELEKMLAECDDVIKESDYHVATLESFKKTVSLTFSESGVREKFDSFKRKKKKCLDEDDAGDLELLKICLSETFKGDNYDQTNDPEKDQLFLTEGPTENDTDEDEVGDGILPDIANRISDLTKMLQLQLTETDDTYERLLGQQSQRYKEMNDNSARLDWERKENFAQLENEKIQCQHVKEAKAVAMCQWEEDHQNQVKDELETQQIHIQKLEEFMEKERETAAILTQIQQEEQKKREMKSAIKIQSFVRMFRMRKRYRIVLEERGQEEKKKKEEEEEKAKQEERRKIEEEKEKIRLKEEERIKREEEEEERKKKEIEKRKREKEEKKAEEERMKKEEERKKKEEEEKKKKEEEKRKRKKEEEKRNKEEEEKRMRKEEEKRNKEEEEKRKKEEEKKKKEEEERKKKEEEEEKKKEEERKKREEKEENIKKEAEAEERRKREVEESKKEEEKERQRKEVEEQVKREKGEKREGEEKDKREERERTRGEEEEGEREKKEDKEGKKCEMGGSRRNEEKEERRRDEEGVEIEESVKRKDEEENVKEVERERGTKSEGEKGEEEDATERRDVEEKEEKMSESEILQTREKEVQKRRETEEDTKARNVEAAIEKHQDSKMADLYFEMGQSVNVEMKNSKNKADDQHMMYRVASSCDKNTGDQKQTIKEGVLTNKEMEGECEKENEERNEEVEFEKKGESGKELKPEGESVSPWKMEDKCNKDGSHEIKKRDLKIMDDVPVISIPSEDQKDMNVVTKIRKVEETNLLPLRQTLNVRRLAWMENCLPWGKISNQNWIGERKDHALKKSERKRPPSKKRLPNPISETVILSATKCTSLTQVTSVHLKNLNGFTLTTLGQCLHLQYLSVNNCQLLTLDGLQTCSQLKYIDLKNNNVEYVNVKAMGNLQILDLSHNNLSLIHGLEECSNLLWLNLQHNRITKLGFGLGSLRRLHTLLLGHNQLISTSGLQDGGAGLQTLDISHNQLQYVTDIEKFCLLRSLDVSSNNLLQTPDLTNHVLIQELSLSDNCLSSLIELSQCWLPLLQVLNVGQNRLSSVPPMEFVHSLKMMDIRNNQILDSVEIVKNLSNCERLEQLLLEGNPLSQEHDIREQMTQAFLHLRYLDWGYSGTTDACLIEKENPLKTLSSKISADHNGFDRICADQTKVFEKLETELKKNLKSLSETDPLDLSGLCDAHLKWCQKSLRTAVECRYAHEYGDTSFRKLVGESTEQERESTSTPNNTETTQIVAEMTSPEMYSNTSCQTADKSQDCSSKGQASEAHLDRSGHDHSVVAAPGFEMARQEHATTAAASSTTTTTTTATSSAAAATAAALSAKHLEICEYRRLPSKPEVPKEDCDQNETDRSYNFRNFRKESDALLAKRNKAATRIQAAWRGYCLRVKLHAALEFAQNVYEEESEFGEEIDLTSFDMAEADLEKTWTVSDTPPLPMNFPVLGRPPPSRSSSRYQLRLPKSQDENRLNQENSPSPAHPRLAWNTPDVSARTIQPINAPLRPRGSEVLRLSPPPTSASGTRENDLPALMSRRKDDEICKEWGFKDARTAQMMLQRAKKMKFNAERREKLKKLDPHQRLALFRKLGEVIPVMPVKSPSRKMLPKKEYFKARQLNMGLNIGYFEMMSKEEENQIKESRTYQWIHTQITPFDNDQKSQQSLSEKSFSQKSKKSFNPCQRVILFQRPQVSGDGFLGSGTSELGRSAMDNESEPSRDSRRHSTPGSANRPVHLPPIDRSSVSTRRCGGSMSHWNPDVERSGGWGGGKKRNKRKRSANGSGRH